MHLLDYLVIALIFLSLLAIGFYLSRIAGKDTSEFYIAGRKMPWWLVGISDVSTGLNTSSMLQDSRKVRQDGVMGLMHIWAFSLKTCIAGVFFERLWRRARFKTQMEFYRARYSGWQAVFARVYDTVIFGGIVTSIWAAVGLVGVKKVALVVMDLPQTVLLAGIPVSTESIVVVVVVLVAMLYSAVSGARGIYWTDLVELVVIVVAVYTLLFILYFETGGSTGLRENIESLPERGYRYLNFLQPLSIVYIGFFIINPFLDHGGFNPGMQRILSVKDEREVLFMTIYKVVLGFVIRVIPFIIIGLIGMFIISDEYLLNNFPPLFTPEGIPIPDFERAFPELVKQYLPVGMVGLMVAAFLCAFMSSFDSNIHLTGAVLINDLYRPYLVKKKDEHHYVLATKVVMVTVSFAAIGIGIFANDILYLGYLAITITLGSGWIKLLRIIWWRSNGTADVAAQIFSFCWLVYILSPMGKGSIVFLMGLMGLEGNDAFIVTRNVSAAVACTLIGLIAMALSKPEPMDKLCSFYKRMRPFGFWGPVRRQLGDSVVQPDPIGVQVALVICMLGVGWGSFFGVMAFFLASWSMMANSFLISAVGLYGSRHFIFRLYPRGWEEGVVQNYDED